MLTLSHTKAKHIVVLLHEIDKPSVPSVEENRVHSIKSPTQGYS
jgi:hypothetical protein